MFNEGHAKNFLKNYFDQKGNLKKLLPNTKFTVRHDRWDMEDYNSIIGELKELGNAEDELAESTPTGGPAMTDMFFSLSKARVELRKQEEIRASYLVNRTVMEQAFDLDEYKELRIHTAGDTVSAALGCVAMEPELEILFDKLQEEQELAQKLEEQMDEMKSLAMQFSEDGEDDVADGNGDGSETQEEKNAKIAEAMKKLYEEMEKTADGIDRGLDEKIPELKEQLKKTLNVAKEQGENLDSLSSTWGLDSGQLSKLPAMRRIELAQKMNGEKFRRIAQLLGPLVRMAFSEQKRKTLHANEELYDVELGNNISNILPIEMMMMGDEDMDIVFWNKYIEKKLMQYKLKGKEDIVKGGIIWAEDGSGSMYGDREIWAKACGIALLQLAHAQKRDFYAVHFGSPGEFKTFDFALNGNLETNYKNHIETFDYVDGVINFAECFFGGGTDFATPLLVALNLLRLQHEKTGAINSDIVFCTDGQCDISDDFMKEFKSEQERLGFQVFGIILGNESNSEPLNTICDGKVFTITDIIPGGNEIIDIFKNI